MLRIQARRLLLAASSAALLLLAGPAVAQAQAQARGADDPMAGAGEAERFSEQDLEAFVEAQEQIQEIGSRYQDRVVGATDPAESQALREQMNQKMVEAVQGAGIDVRTYNEIATSVQTDPALASRVEEMR